MKCYKCNIFLANCKSEYGFYYYCPNCGKTFETSGQMKYNKRYDKQHPNTFINKKEVNLTSFFIFKSFSLFDNKGVLLVHLFYEK